MYVITTLTGENSFLLRAELGRLIADFVTEHGDMALEKIDSQEASYDRMREALESLPFLSSKKLVVLMAPSANKEFVEKAEGLLTDLPEVTDVIIVEPKPDKRTSYYKFLKKQSELKQYDELDEFALVKWLVSAVKERGGSLSQTDAKLLVERVGANQRLVSNELDKLISYDPHINRKSIELLTEKTPQSTIFELLDAALAGNTKKALELYEEQRKLRVEPQQIIAMLGWQLHALALVKTAGDRDIATTAKEAKLNPYVVRKSQNLARRMTLADIKKLVHHALELDVRLKSEAIDADDALQHLLMSIKT